MIRRVNANVTGILFFFFGGAIAEGSRAVLVKKNRRAEFCREAQRPVAHPMQ
jgi:hypothetical protein